MRSFWMNRPLNGLRKKRSSDMDKPCVSNHFYPEHAKQLHQSFEDLLGRPLIECAEGDLAEQLFHAPFALLSHGTESDPIFNYGNRCALNLFEMTWEQLTRTPSRLSAEAPVKEARDALLRRVTEHGFIDDYQGVRVSSTGQRFLIEEAVVWNVIDSVGVFRGQAAALYKWSPL